MFSQVSVCPQEKGLYLWSHVLSGTGVGMSGGEYVRGWVCLGAWELRKVGISRGRVPPWRWDLSGGYVQRLTTPPRHGIQCDMVGKRAVRILLECFLVFVTFTLSK